MKRLLILSAFLLTSLLAQNPNTAVFPTGVVGDGTLFVATNRGQTTLNGSITNSQTTMVLTSGANFVAPAIITVENEILHCTTISGANVSGCTRGAEGSAPASHNSGVAVYGFLSAWHIDQLAAEVKAIEANVRFTDLWVVKTANYTAVAGDANHTIVMNCGSPCTLTLPAAPPAPLSGGSAANWDIGVLNINSTVTLSPNGLNYNGNAASPTPLGKGASLNIGTDGTNYFGNLPYTFSTGITFTVTSTGIAIGVDTTYLATKLCIETGCADSLSFTRNTASTYTATGSPTFTTGYTQGAPLVFTWPQPCEGADTANIDGQGPIHLMKYSNGGFVNISANDCAQGAPFPVVYTTQALTPSGGSITSAFIMAPYGIITNYTLGQGASALNQDMVVGTGGVTANTLVILDTSNPAKAIAATGSGAHGVAQSTVSAAGVVSVARYGVATLLADNTVTAGDLIIAGTGNVTYGKDSGQTSSAAIGIGTRIIGVARTSASASATFQVELTPGHFGTLVNSVNNAAVPTSASLTGTNSSSQLIVADATSVATVRFAVGGGTAQAQTVTLAPAITTLPQGLQVCWLPNAANSGAAPTLAVNGLTAHSIVKVPNATALVANDLITTQLACALYDTTGTQWELQDPATSFVYAIPMPVSGATSGGVACFTSATVLNTSAALTLNRGILGGGAGACPTVDSNMDSGVTTANTRTISDSAGLAVPNGPVKVGTAPATTNGTAGGWGATEGTACVNATSAACTYPDSTLHEIMAKTNGSASAGMMVRSQPGAISLSGQTGTITATTLCAASAGACNVAGEYHVHVDLWESVACATPGSGGVTFALTWTDESATTHSAVVLPLMVQTSATVITSQTLFAFSATLANTFASGDFTISTNGTVIQYTITYVACSSGSGTYGVRAAVSRLQ